MKCMWNAEWHTKVLIEQCDAWFLILGWGQCGTSVLQLVTPFPAEHTVTQVAECWQVFFLAHTADPPTAKSRMLNGSSPTVSPGFKCWRAVKARDQPGPAVFLTTGNTEFYNRYAELVRRWPQSLFRSLLIGVLCILES